ncbi:DgyrCDS9096 [Dimorphilus gyrociliatus]|uniref:DgyrCDS9096 n=1 Tax=Dimorphilus gyrociliatus TaxID=2664684 RepID=A0A7I8VW25_9ANNE|nr:DgyrCDS9096 [Dimorphilus gyrociliatus]
MNRLGISLADKRLEESKKYLLENCLQEDFDYPQIFYDHTEKLWRDNGVLKCYARNAEYQLIDCAKYFLDKIDVIRLDSYLPSDHDILHCRILTNSIQKIEFTVMDKKSRIPFHVFDVGGQRGERKKWIQMFDSATAILFLLDCSSFDVNVRDDFESNRLLEATEVFEHIWNSRFLKNVSLILFVNKIDLLEGKIRSGSSIDNLVKSIPSTHKYFPVYDRVYREFSKPLDQERKEFIDSFLTREKKPENRLKFRRRSSRSPSVQPEILDEIVKTAVIIKRVFMEVAHGSKKGSEGREFHRGHYCEPFYTCAIDTDNIQKVLEGVRSILIKKALRWLRKGLNSQDMKKLHPVYTLNDSWDLPRHFEYENYRLDRDNLEEDMIKEFEEYSRQFCYHLRRVRSHLLSEISDGMMQDTHSNAKSNDNPSLSTSKNRISNREFLESSVDGIHSALELNLSNDEGRDGRISIWKSENCTFIKSSRTIVNGEISELCTSKNCSNVGANFLIINWNSASSSFRLRVYDSELKFINYKFDREPNHPKGEYRYTCVISRGKMEEWKSVQLSCTDETSCSPKSHNNINYISSTKLNSCSFSDTKFPNSDYTTFTKWCEFKKYNFNGLIGWKIKPNVNPGYFLVHQQGVCPTYVKITNAEDFYSESIKYESSNVIESAARLHGACWNNTALVFKIKNDTITAKWTLVDVKCKRDYEILGSSSFTVTVAPGIFDIGKKLGVVYMNNTEYSYEIPLKYNGSYLEIKPNCEKQTNLDCSCDRIREKINVQMSTSPQVTNEDDKSIEISTKPYISPKSPTEFVGSPKNHTEIIVIICVTGGFGIILLVFGICFCTYRCRCKRGYKIVHFVCDNGTPSNNDIAVELFGFLRVVKEFETKFYDLSQDVDKNVKFFLIILSENKEFNDLYIRRLDFYKNCFIFASLHEHLKSPTNGKVYYIPKDMRKLLKALGAHVNEDLYKAKLFNLRDTIERVNRGEKIVKNYERQNSVAGVHFNSINEIIPPEDNYDIAECKQEYENCHLQFKVEYDEESLSSDTSDTRRHSDPVSDCRQPTISISKTSVV